MASRLLSRSGLASLSPRRQGTARRLLVEVRRAAVRVGAWVGSLVPVRDVVVLATSYLPRIGGNLAFIHDELAARDDSPPVVILASAVPKSIAERVQALFSDAIAGYRIASSRLFIVDDYYFPLYQVRRREGTTVVQVWHACGAFKRFGYSALDGSFGATPEAVARHPIHTNYDLCLISSMNVAPAYADAFHQPLEKFASRFGIPRTDAFFGPDLEERADAIRRRYGIPAGRRIVLYAPTFRGDSVGSARTPTDLDLDALQRTLAEDHVVLLRLHPFVRTSTTVEPGLRGFVIDVSDHPEINELMLASDVLVTDYSSAIYEFSLLRRPMAFFAPDIESYESERGFYFDYRSGVPGPVFETTEELGRWLRAGEVDLDRVEHFREASFDVADGRSTARFVDEVVLRARADPRA